MGGSTYSAYVHSSTTASSIRDHGTAFTYSAAMDSVPRAARKVHPNLDPKKLNKAGLKIRESRDSDTHPETTAIAVVLDETGSMMSVFSGIQEALPRLNSILVGKGYLAGPQILFAAIGDATCGEIAPIQVGQFESGNEMDSDLTNVLIEQGGGGGTEESYELALYFLNKYSSTDCWLKRGRKGYIFIVGDERAYPRVDRRFVEHYIGDTLQESLSTDDILKELQRRYEVFYILPRGASHGGELYILNYWRDRLGQNVLELDDPTAVAELIAAQIGSCEGFDETDVRADLLDSGASLSTVEAVSRAISTNVNGGNGGRNVAEVDRPLPEIQDDEDTTTRL